MEEWDKEKFDGLTQVVEYLGDKPLLGKYRDYCTFREKGMRKEAFHSLKGFLNETAKWTFEERKDFVDWILWIHNSLPHIPDLLPNQMLLSLIEPTLAEWMIAEPENGCPYRWSGGIENLRKAISLDRNDDIAKLKFGKIILNDSNYSVHELPEGYLGNPREDLEDVSEAIGYVRDAIMGPERDAILGGLESNREKIENWIRESGPE
jgi:hypothetical protein